MASMLSGENGGTPPNVKDSAVIGLIWLRPAGTSAAAEMRVVE